MRTMTIPSANMRRLKQVAAASRASQAATPAAPLPRRPAGDGVSGDARGPGRVHRTTTPSSSSKRRAAAPAGGDANGRDKVRVVRPAPPVPASSNSSSGKRGAATAPPAPARAVRADPPAPPAGGKRPVRLVVGDRVMVTTPVTPTLAGQHILITLGAVVVSAEEEDRYGDSYLEVVFDGEFPPHAPSSSVRISRDQVVMSTPIVAATKPSASGATSTAAPAPQRPVKREAAGSATSLRGGGQQNSNKKSRY